MTRLAGIDIGAPPVVVLPLFVVALLGVALLAARGVSGLTARWLRTPDDDGDAAARARAGLAIPVAAAVLIGGLLLVIPEVAMPGRLGRWAGTALTMALLLACALVLARVAIAGMTAYATQRPSLAPALGVARVAVRLAIGVLAVITALETMGVPVAPLLTTLGVGSLAVALALQETLANFFAGLYLLADRPVRSGDYIKIHDGEEGFVESIGWRSSRLRTHKNNIVIVPNQKLSQAVLTNFHLPAPAIAMTVPVTVSYESDPDAVEVALTDELLRAVGEVPEIEPTAGGGAGAPLVRLVELGDSGMVFHCLVNVRDVSAQGAAAHQLRKRIVARLRREGMSIAYPRRVVHTTAATGS